MDRNALAAKILRIEGILLLVVGAWLSLAMGLQHIPAHP
jgi:hypothetical protein